MADKVLTGVLAIIRVHGTPVGKMKNISWTENISRGEVRGIGTAMTSEVPALTWSGSGSCEFYEVDFTTTGIPGLIRRDVQTDQEFEDNLVLQGDGVQLDIFKKVEDLIDENDLIIPKAVPYAILGGMYIESEGSDVTEGAISSHRTSFRYLKAIKRPS